MNKLDGNFIYIYKYISEIAITFSCIYLTHWLFSVALQSAQFYKVTTENYHKAADQVNAKYK